MRPSTALATTALLAALAGSCGGPPGGAVRPVGTPAAPGSLAPDLAEGLDGRLYLSWIEPRAGGHALRFSTWTGDAWSPPRTVAEGDDWFVNWADFPSMAALADGTLAAHWLERSGEGTYAYDVRVAASADGGETWSAPLTPHDDGTETEHGFATLVPTPAGTFEIVWLDGRRTADTPRGAMTLRAASLTPDLRLSREAVLDERVCDCCATDAARPTDGALVAVYRDRSPAEVRDISTVRSTATGWSGPRSIHDDGWTIAGCPVNGPALAAADDTLVVAWFTAADNVGRVKAAFSRDGGRTFEAPVRIDEGEPLGRVDTVLLDDGTALVSWLEQGDGEARIVLRRVSPAGPLETTRVAATAATRSSGFPRLARVGGDVMLAWTVPDEPSRIATALVPTVR